jgi:Tfp pilus assembly protein PilF
MLTEPEALLALRGDDPARAAEAEAALWAMWCHSDDATVRADMAAGIAAMERGDLHAARERFDAIVARAPAFAEGWNKRATVRYLARDFRGAIADCEEVLARKPHHFGALSGQGLCHLAIAEAAAAAQLFRRALAVHPHLAAVRENLRLAVNEVVRWN